MVNVWTSAGQRASMLKIIYKRKIASLWLEWNALRGFRDLNQEGVKKALKKSVSISCSPSIPSSFPNFGLTLFPSSSTFFSPFRFDKITRSSTKDDFLAETLPTFYPWLAETKSVLDEHDQRLITTYARVVVGGDMELAGKQLGSQLREKVVIERDTSTFR
jgi:phosphate transporter